MRINRPQTLSTQGWQTDPDALEQLGMEEAADELRMEHDLREDDIRRNDLDDLDELRGKRKRKIFSVVKLAP